ncbi:MAG: hypothetical protein NTV89_08040 [Proteobacteria bacterium]|nr:hypothetical protein [Pseudomonadota bacterium]
MSKWRKLDVRRAYGASMRYINYLKKQLSMVEEGKAPDAPGK